MNSSTKCKFISVFLILSLLLSFCTLFSFADSVGDGSEEESGVNVIYNRGFEEGWSYTNGLSVGVAGANVYTMPYVQRSASFYDYCLKITVKDDKESTLVLDAGKNVVKEGHTYLELDVMADSGADISNALTAYTSGEGAESEAVFLMSFNDGGLYLLGRRVADCDGKWLNVAFKFDFDYAKNNTDADPSEYRVTVFWGEGNSFSKVLTAGDGGFGIKKLVLGAGADEGAERAGDSYSIDDLKLYCGTEGFISLDDYGVGSAVDASLPRDMEILSFGSSKDAISGSPSLDRVEITKEDLAKDDGPKVIYNRYFSEGWGWKNGVRDATRNNLFELRYDYSAEYNKGETFANHYLYIEKTQSTDGFIQIPDDANSPIFRENKATGKLYFEFDVKASENLNVGTVIMLIQSATDGSVTYPKLLSINNGKATVLGTEIGYISNEWLHIAFEFDFDAYRDDETDATPEKMRVTVYYGEDGQITTDLNLGKYNFQTFRIQSGESTGDFGGWYGLDNVQIYYGTDGFATLPLDEYGKSFDASLDKDFITDSSAGTSASVAEIYDSSLTMKLGVNYAFLFGERVPIYEAEDGTAYGAPRKIDGKAMLPLEIIASFTEAGWLAHDDGITFEVYFGKTVSVMTLGNKEATVNGKRVILSAAPGIYTDSDGNSALYVAMDDIEAIFPGYYITYDDMGLVTVSRYKNFVTRNASGGIEAMVDVMRKFIFDFFEEDEIYDAIKETTSFEHPYMYVTQNEFDEIYRKYNASLGTEDFDSVFISWVDQSVKKADDFMKAYAKFDETGAYVGLSEAIINPYPETGGYDPVGGRLSILTEPTYDGKMGYTYYLNDVAFAYQATRNTDYALFALDIAVALGRWEHWGPGHMLNCAGAAGNLALTYDWLYNAWQEIDKEKCSFVAEKIYENGAYEGYLSVNWLPLEHPRIQGDASNWIDRDNNWNQWCADNMIRASIALLGDLDDAKVEKLKNLITKSFYHAVMDSMTIFAPDGSYTEGLGYWDGTISNHLSIAALLESVAGDDYGYNDCWGIDKTYYYALNCEFGDYLHWAYHDESMSSSQIASSMTMLFYYANAVGDTALADIRRYQCENGRPATLWDCIYYYDGSGAESVDMDLDYRMEALEGYLSRSSWDKDALFVGIMGGANDAGHANIDSGNWIYVNKEVLWFCDLGQGNYNAHNYFGNYYLYRRGGEGQNVVILDNYESAGLPYGQKLNGGGTVIDEGVNEYGSYAVIDNTSAYGEDLVSWARRGMMLTNDRKTVIIQDEISFKEMTTAYWFAHYELTTSSQKETKYGRVLYVELADDDTTAYLTARGMDGQIYTLRVKIITQMRGVRFEKWNAYTYVLDGTYKPGQSESMGADSERSRAGIEKLVISVKNQQNFNIAVAIELVDREEEVDHGYKWTAIKDWAPYADTREGFIGDDTNSSTVRPNPSMASVSNSVRMLDTLGDTLLLGGLETFYQQLANAEYAISRFGRDTFSSNETLAGYLASYDGYKARYDGFIKNPTAAGTAANSIARALICAPAAPPQ